MSENLTASLLVDCKNELGEGIQWNSALQRVFWTDIFGNALWSCNEDGGEVERLDLPGGLCAFAFFEDGRMLCAFTDGIYEFNAATGKRGLIAEYQPEFGAGTRMNDGGLDRQGRFVVGGIDEDGMKPITDVWSVAKGSVRTILEGVGCANSIVFSPDGRLMYFADTKDKDIFVFDYDLKTGTPSNKRLFATLGEGEGKPDGSCVDAEGGLWNAQFGGGGVQRFLAAGQRDIRVGLPVPDVTCCCIGGKNLDRLFITTARIVLSENDLARHPQSGGLFCCPIDAKGLHEPVYVSG